MREWELEGTRTHRHILKEVEPGQRYIIESVRIEGTRYFRDGLFLTDWSFWATIVIIGLIFLWAHFSPGGPPPEGDYCIRETW